VHWLLLVLLLLVRVASRTLSLLRRRLHGCL
jgi:hypothetical protein